MGVKVGVTEARRLILKALQDGTFQHEARSDIDVKNLLQLGAMTAEGVIEIIK